MRVLVTGGAGFIGSHTVLELLKSGEDVVVVDDLSNSSAESLKRVEEIAGKKLIFYCENICDRAAMERIFSTHDFDWVIHFAGFKAVGESVRMPLTYYQNNLGATLNLLEIMQKFSVKRLVFSSSATVYGVPERLPLDEDCAVSATNPYGATKLMQERILRDLYVSDESWTVVLLRYFNPIGADESGLIGEDPKGTPNNLLPYVARVAAGKLDKVRVFGNDYPTPDGTGIRDYIHVTDLAKGHLAAMKILKSGVYTYNLGTGKGSSVLEVIEAFSRASGKKIPYEFAPRREGDVAACYASAKRAEEELGWHAERDLDKMCRDAWNWQSRNPDGYKK